MTQKIQNNFLIAIALIFMPAMLLSQITDQERQKIEDAIPKQAMVTLKKPRKILVVTLHKRDGKVMQGHASIPYGNLALKLISQK